VSVLPFFALCYKVETIM